MSAAFDPDPAQMLREARLQDAIGVLTDKVRSNPADASSRIGLCELLCFAGDFDRVLKQVSALAALSAAHADTCDVYRWLVDGERQRRDVFDGRRRPAFLASPPPDVERLLLAFTDDVGATAEAALDTRPASCSGRLNGEAFDTFSDADDRTVSVLEAFIGRDYYWIPFSAIVHVQIDPPVTYRDLLWRRAELLTRDGSRGGIYVPALYAGSHAHPDDAVKLGHKTDWNESARYGLIGVGQRLWLAGDREFPFLDIREIDIDAETPR